jgi:hypothetical protein
MGMRKTTIVIMGVLTLAALLWDLVAFLFGKDATISVIITDWSYYTPWPGVVWGFLMGHWFWPAKRSGV